MCKRRTRLATDFIRVLIALWKGHAWSGFPKSNVNMMSSDRNIRINMHNGVVLRLGRTKRFLPKASHSQLGRLKSSTNMMGNKRNSNINMHNGVLFRLGRT